MTNAPLPNLTCPRCGSPNQCEPAQSGSFDTPCWCASVQVSPDALASLDGKRDACLCPACAKSPG